MDKPDSPILMDVADGVAVITLNRPEIHNAFDDHLIASLSGKFDILRCEKSVRALVLRGAGKSFSAGGDLNWMKRAASYTEEENYQDGLLLAGMLNKLYTLPQTTIACVQGAAMGGGMGLVCCCDIALTTAQAVFALSEVKLGLIPATIGPYVMRAIGERQMRRYAQTGERIDGARALEIGLAHELFESESAMEEGLKAILDAAAQNGPEAMAASKKLCRDLAGRNIDEGLIDETARMIARIRAGAEAKDGLSAFLEKRPPAWRKP
ncbi:MAG TPA: enoyl-CoA hydratase-related protein [Micavibrio sp.]